MLGHLQQDEKDLVFLPLSRPRKYDIRKVANHVATKNSDMETSMETSIFPTTQGLLDYILTSYSKSSPKCAIFELSSGP